MLRKMPKIEKGKVKITGVVITVSKVLAWMKQQGRFVESVEMRDVFNWPLRGTARNLMKLLEADKKVVIVENPHRKRAWVYGLPNVPLPTKETFVDYKSPKSDKELGKGKFANNNKPKICPDYQSKECNKKLGVVACQATKKHSQFKCPVIEKAGDLVVAEGGEIVETKPEKPTNDPEHAKIQKNIEENIEAGKELTANETPVANPWQGK